MTDPESPRATGPTFLERRPATPAAPHRRRLRFALAGLALLVIVVYIPSLSAPFIFDDERNIVDNEALTGASWRPADLWRAAWESPLGSRPLAYFTFTVNWLAGGLVAFHAVNLAVHLATTFLVFALFRLWLGRERSPWPALLAAALWSLSPIHVQAVAYVVQRMTSMMAMWFLAAVLAFVAAGRRRVAGSRCARPFVLGCVCSALAVATKEMAVLIPAALLLVWWLTEEKGDVQALLRRRGWIAVAVAGTALLGLFVVVARDTSPVELATRQHAYEFVPLGHRLWTFPRVVLHYASLLLWPHPSRANIDPQFTPSTGALAPPSTLVAVLVVVGAVVAALLLVRHRPALSLGILWFVAFLVPEHTVLQLDLVFDHHAYLPSIGLFALVGVALGATLTRGRRWARAVLVASGVAIVMSGAWTLQRNLTWRDPVALWTQSAERSPAMWRPALNLARALYGRQQYEEAEPWFREAWRRAPGIGAAPDELGQMLIRMGRLDAAESVYREAAPRIEEPELAWLMIASIRRLARDFDGVLAALRKAEEIAPDDPRVQRLLGVFLAARGDTSAAEAAYRRSLELDPEAALSWAELSRLLRSQGRIEEADEAMSRARRLDPASVAGGSQGEEFRPPSAGERAPSPR